MEPEARGVQAAGLFEAGGPVAAALPAFEPRPQQAAMASAVEAALEGGRTLVVEAGTGVGKSLAYLVPAAQWAARRGKRAAVATYTKTLQEQLLQKDIPAVKAALAPSGAKPSFALLMGSENYLCDRRARRCLRRGPELFDGAGQEAAVSRLLDWAREADTGLRTRIPFEVPEPLWELVRREPDLCLHRRCPVRETCLYRKDVARARAASVVVANQHLLFAGIPLPPFDAVILDEAHNLEEVAAQFLGFTLTSRKVERLLDDIHNPRRRRGPALCLGAMSEAWVEALAVAAGRARKAADLFFDEAAAWMGPPAAGGRTRRVREPGFIPDTLSGPLQDLGVLLSEAAARAGSAEDEAEARSLMDRCLAAVERLAEFLDLAGRGHAHWVEASVTRRGRLVSLHAAPLDVSKALRKELFDGRRPVVLTSATLAVDGSFDLLRSRLGVGEADELSLDSPFDYGAHAAVYVDREVPDPKAEPEAYEAAVLARCRELASEVPGGVFALFTSWSLLHKAGRALTAETVGRPVFRQGDKPAFDLIASFKEAGNGLLLGTDTFWQGVDVRGRALSAVILTRLPFLSPDSPLEEARREWLASRGKDAFAEYVLPKAVIKFRQGFGRLIRSKTDMGAVVILDPRVLTRPYGKLFLRSIPRCRELASLADLLGFLRGLGPPGQAQRCSPAA